MKRLLLLAGLAGCTGAIHYPQLRAPQPELTLTIKGNLDADRIKTLRMAAASTRAAGDAKNADLLDAVADALENGGSR